MVFVCLFFLDTIYTIKSNISINIPRTVKFIDRVVGDIIIIQISERMGRVGLLERNRLWKYNRLIQFSFYTNCDFIR